MENIREVKELVNKIDRVYLESARESLMSVTIDTYDKLLKKLKDEINAENPYREKIKDLSTSLYNDLRVVSLTNSKVDDEMIPLAIELLKYFNN